MAGTRSESWWQPPKDFDAPIDPEQVLDEAAAPKNTKNKKKAAAGRSGDWDGWGGRADRYDDERGGRTKEVDADDADLVVPVGWTVPTGDVAPPDPSNRRFYLGVVLIALATAVGVLAALRLAPDDGKDSRRSATSTTTPSAVRGETTVRQPGALSAACLDEKNRVQRAEQAYAGKDANHQYADMGGLVASGALTAPSSWFVIVNENLGTPPLAQVNGVALHEYEDFLVVPVPGGPCDTTT
jgi:hypothetical protein